MHFIVACPVYCIWFMLLNGNEHVDTRETSTSFSKTQISCLPKPCKFDYNTVWSYRRITPESIIGKIIKV